MGWSQELPQTYNINIKQEEQNLYDNRSNFCHRYYNTGMVITVCWHSLGKALLPHYTIGGGGSAKTYELGQVKTSELITANCLTVTTHAKLLIFP